MNAAAVDPVSPQGAEPLVSMFAGLADERGDHPALVGVARTVTFGELERRGNQVANALRAAGVARSVDFVAELPRNPSGKLLKRVIRAPYWTDVEHTEGRQIG